MTTKLLYNKIYNPSKEIIYSVIIPIYNQENIVVENLQSIINNTSDNFEIIMILDFCFDNTEQNIMNFLDNYDNKVDNLLISHGFKSRTQIQNEPSKINIPQINKIKMNLF